MTRNIEQTPELAAILAATGLHDLDHTRGVHEQQVVPDGRIDTNAVAVGGCFFDLALTAKNSRVAERAQHCLFGAALMAPFGTPERALLDLLLEATYAVGDDLVEREMAENAVAQEAA